MRLRSKGIVAVRNKLAPRHGMVPVPDVLRPAQLQPYPADNTPPFEQWYMLNYGNADQCARLYLPVQWTALYCNNQYGGCSKTQMRIQAFLDGLDKTKKYYTIVQYDDGILNDLAGFDIKVFAMSGPRVDYPLPLLCQPHKYQFPNCKKDIFASFVGRITHSVRAALVKQLNGLPGYYISSEQHNLKDYCHILARSKYALCPRGYGQTSFRIQEAIQYGAIPVYISDDFIVPYNISTMFPMVHSENIADGFYELLWFATLTMDYQTEVNNHAHLYTYAGCKQMILKELKNEMPTNIL